MQKKLIEMILSTLNPKMIAEILVGVLWELAKRTDNSIDDEIVKGIAKHFDIDPEF